MKQHDKLPMKGRTSIYVPVDACGLLRVRKAKLEAGAVFKSNAAVMAKNLLVRGKSDVEEQRPI